MLNSQDWLIFSQSDLKQALPLCVSALSFKPKILQRKSIIERVAEKIKTFIDTFIEGMGGSV